MRWSMCIQWFQMVGLVSEMTFKSYKCHICHNFTPSFFYHTASLYMFRQICNFYEMIGHTLRRQLLECIYILATFVILTFGWYLI